MLTMSLSQKICRIEEKFQMPKDGRNDREQQEELKEAVKEAIHDWMDEKYAMIGRWTTNLVVMGLVAGALYLALIADGWVKK